MTNIYGEHEQLQFPWNQAEQNVFYCLFIYNVWISMCADRHYIMYNHV